jgi:hypothetical protein
MDCSRPSDQLLAARGSETKVITDKMTKRKG